MATDSSSMNEELDSRLDQLFEDDQSKKKESKGEPLENLQAVVLEMEWEIGDSNLDTYLLELKRVGEQYKGNKPLCVYIKLLDTMGRYLKAKKASAHPETVSFLQSLYESFKVAVGAPDKERNHLASEQINAFKQFKAAIAEHSATRVSSPAASQHASGPAEQGLTDETRAYIRKVVREEIARLVKRK